MTPIQQVAIGHRQSLSFAIGFVVLLLAGGALGLVGALTPRALRIARLQPLPRVRHGLWLACCTPRPERSLS